MDRGSIAIREISFARAVLAIHLPPSGPADSGFQVPPVPDSIECDISSRNPVDAVGSPIHILPSVDGGLKVSHEGRCILADVRVIFVLVVICGRPISADPRTGHEFRIDRLAAAQCKDHCH